MYLYVRAGDARLDAGVLLLARGGGGDLGVVRTAEFLGHLVFVATKAQKDVTQICKHRG